MWVKEESTGIAHLSGAAAPQARAVAEKLAVTL
jgi:hypothetical protein